ncbi:MAG TPA: phage tail protein [Polyangiaceae bacterium]
MDVNGTRFHLLLGEDDWKRCVDRSDVEYDERAQEQTLRALTFRFVAGATDQPPRLEQRRGAARDRYGNWYCIAEDERTLRVKSTGTRSVSDFWPVPAEARAPAGDGRFGPAAKVAAKAPPRLAGVAVTTHHYLVVGCLEPVGFLIFDLYAGGAPVVFEWPVSDASLAMTPFDLAPAPDGGVYVLDRERGRYWILDARFRVAGAGQAERAPARRDAFQPLGGGMRESEARSFPLGVDVGAVPVEGAGGAIGIEVLPDATVLVLDRGSGGRVLCFRGGVPFGPPVKLELGLLFPGVDFSPPLVPHDFAYVEADAEDGRPRLYVATSDGNQALAFAVSVTDGGLRLEPIEQYFPMRLFTGKALVAASGRSPVEKAQAPCSEPEAGIFYDHPGGFIPLVRQQRPRFVERGALETPVFDGREPDCVWHRLVLDGRIPEGANVQVLSRAANDPSELANLAFLPEPLPYRRGLGAELPYLSREAVGDLESFELLFQRARGRYLQLRLELSGNGRVTPRLRALRAWYPRFSYLEQYLPAAYREEPDSASFLERFLANPEGTLTGIEDRIAAVQTLFDVRSAPSDALEWLAGWFGVALDPAWEDERRRLFIRHAMDFFQYRGTIQGLTMALRLALDRCADESIFTDPDPGRAAVRVVERYRARFVPGVFSGDTSDGAGIAFVAPERRWLPAQGAQELDRRYREAMNGAGQAGQAAYPIRAPSGDALAAAWSRFSLETLGFVPAASEADARAWLEFLASRYPGVAELNAAYLTSFTELSRVALPAELPRVGAALRDWYQFETIVLPMRATAHRFRVLVPTSFGADRDRDRAARLELAARIIELEKPAHTAFDVRFYYAMFRVGEARLGFDSLIDLGGRAPELMAPFVLGPGYLSEGYLAAHAPGDARDRSVLGRERLPA